MYCNCLLLVLIILVGCTNAVRSNGAKLPAASSEKAISVSPAQNLAKLITQQEDLGAQLHVEFANSISQEKQYWQEEFSHGLTGPEREKAMVELRDFQKDLEQKANELTSTAMLEQKIAEFLGVAFSENELRTISQFMESREWRKYQFVMGQMRFSPDTLGLRAEFAKVVDDERNKMAIRIFGADAVQPVEHAVEQSANSEN